MLLTAAATGPVSANQPSRVARLLDLARKLIDYGKELAVTLRQRDVVHVARCFGTRDIALILSSITRGLLRANALEARLVQNAARLDAVPRRRDAPAQRRPRPARPADPCGDEADPRLAALPTPEQIAAEVRRRPIGVVIADICRDLGILPSHPLWRELSLLIIRHGDSLAALVMDVIARGCGSPLSRAGPQAPPASPAPAGTGPP
ncbi:MAG TPA: hypothetical protein VKI44_37850 [Acetobacteraceae bacterium]|nr:hypothetical protein [Acetobacteraceae bacterium]